VALSDDAAVTRVTIMSALRQRIDPAFLPGRFVSSNPCRQRVGKLPRVAVEDLVTRLAAKAG